MKTEQKMRFRESVIEGVFTVRALLFSEQMQFKTQIYRVVDNSALYQNIELLF
jgi:hypothetical protein